MLLSSAGTTGIYTKTICSETKWLQRRCFPEGSAKCSSRRIRIAEQENFLCPVPVEENFFFSFLLPVLRMPKLAMRRSRWRWYYLVRWNAELHSPKLSVLLKSEKKKHLISMKNSCLYDERWNPNDDGIRKNITNMVFDAWWRQSWFRESRFVFMFFHPYESWSESAQNFFVLAILRSRG